MLHPEDTIEPLVDQIICGNRDGLMMASSLLARMEAGQDTDMVALGLNIEFETANQSAKSLKSDRTSRCYLAGVKHGMLSILLVDGEIEDQMLGLLNVLSGQVEIIKTFLLEWKRDVDAVAPAHHGRQRVCGHFMCDKCGETIYDDLDIQEALELRFAGDEDSLFGDGLGFVVRICDPCAHRIFRAYCDVL
ncbi:MAG: hypothetical protein M0Z99_14235 [Betaproteobacteria bacterium]|nr:hypothetical protein [Betaproteobacteria bacterium]